MSVGRTGLKVSQLCLGTMVFGGPAVDESESYAVLDAAEELGITFLDVADVYPSPRSLATMGQGEELIGRWLRRASGRRERFVVATKFGDQVAAGANNAGGSRKHVIEACEASLRRLNTDRIDLYWMHKPDPTTPLEETLEALTDLVEAGKVHYIGASNYEAWRLGLALSLASERGSIRFVALQCRWSLLERRMERDLLPLCQAAGMAVIPYNPLAGGLLTGKYGRGTDSPRGARFTAGDWAQLYRERYWSDAALDVVDIVVRVSHRERITPAQLALAWLLHKAGLTCPIVGASRRSQLIDNVKALDITLSDETVTELDQASVSFT